MGHLIYDMLSLLYFDETFVTSPSDDGLFCSSIYLGELPKQSGVKLSYFLGTIYTSAKHTVSVVCEVLQLWEKTLEDWGAGTHHSDFFSHRLPLTTWTSHFSDEQSTWNRDHFTFEDIHVLFHIQ